MKLSKQERIGALIILAIVILALGAFLLIKPKIQEIGSTQNTLDQKKLELSDARAKQARKDPLRTEIEQAYVDGEHLADMFFPELKSYEADDAFREFIKQCKIPVIVEEITVGEPSTEELSVTFYTPSEVNYALKSYVTQGLEPSEEEQKFAMRNAVLQSALSNTLEIGSSQVQFTVSALTQDDLIAFTDEVNNYIIKDENAPEGEEGIRKAIKMSTISLEYPITNYYYDEFVDASTAVMGEAGQAAISELENEGDTIGAPLTEPIDSVNREGIEGYKFGDDLPYTLSDTLTFYSIERMQNPQSLLDSQDGIVSE